jgi:hypothetical protein
MLLATAPQVSALRRAVEAALVRPATKPQPTAARWAWLANTYWYVPTPNLPALIYDSKSGALVPVLDQTVYHITGYRNGYFWGETVTQLGRSKPTSTALVGSVTPEGRVLLTFTSSSNATTGYGTMTRRNGVWTMANQMFTRTTTGSLVGHWAYMMQTRPGTRSWSSLPLARVSVPKFLSSYSGPTPKPPSGVRALARV